MTDLTEQEMIKLGEKYLLETEIKRVRAYNFYNNLKDNQEFKERERQRKKDYYIQNRDKLRERDRLRYQNDTEFKEGLKNKYKEKKQKEIDELILQFYKKNKKYSYIYS